MKLTPCSTHLLKKVIDPPYRYQCTRCQRKLKLHNGILIDELKELQRKHIEKKQQEKRN